MQTTKNNKAVWTHDTKDVRPGEQPAGAVAPADAVPDDEPAATNGWLDTCAPQIADGREGNDR